MGKFGKYFLGGLIYVLGIFLGLRFSIPAFFGVGKFGKYFFGGTQNNVKSRGSARVSRPRSSANKVQPNLFCGCLIVAPAFRPEWEIPRRHFSSSLVY